MRANAAAARRSRVSGVSAALMRLQLRQHDGVLAGIDDDGHVAVVLGPGPHQRGAPDVDVLDDLFVRGAGTGDGRLERIQIAYDKVDEADAKLLEDGDVFRVVAHGENAAVDVGVQRLDAAVEHFGEAGHVGHVAHRQAGVGQRLARAAGGNQLDVEGGQAAGQVEQAGLVADAEQGATNDAIRHETPPTDIEPQRRRDTENTKHWLFSVSLRLCGSMLFYLSGVGLASAGGTGSISVMFLSPRFVQNVPGPLWNSRKITSLFSWSASV